MERLVGRAGDRAEAVSVARILGDAGAEARSKRPLAAREPLLAEPLEHVREASHGVLARHAVHPDDELLSAPASNDVVVAKVASQLLPQASQHAVAAGVTVTVVDELEAVEVEHDDRQGLGEAI